MYVGKSNYIKRRTSAKLIIKQQTDLLNKVKLSFYCLSYLRPKQKLNLITLTITVVLNIFLLSYIFRPFALTMNVKQYQSDIQLYKTRSVIL